VYQVLYIFRDVRGVIANPLDVLRHEKQMGTRPDIARIVHHVDQQLAEQFGTESVELFVA
jgi:hypothetical protein